MAARSSFCAIRTSPRGTSSHQSAQSTNRNQFGGTLGGPLRQDKAFFFVDYQGTRMTRGVDTGLISVPSLKNRQGDFSDNASVLAGNVNGQFWADRLSQKLGYAVTPGQPYYTPGCVSSAQ